MIIGDKITSIPKNVIDFLLEGLQLWATASFTFNLYSRGNGIIQIQMDRKPVSLPRAQVLHTILSRQLQLLCGTLQWDDHTAGNCLSFRCLMFKIYFS